MLQRNIPEEPKDWLGTLIIVMGVVAALIYLIYKVFYE